MFTNTICGIPDIDIYLLSYLDIVTIGNLISVSRDYSIVENTDFYRELRLLKQYHEDILVGDIVDYACKYNFLTLIKWIYKSANDFDYSKNAISMAASNGHIRIFNWFISICGFIYDNKAINLASANGARRRSR